MSLLSTLILNEQTGIDLAVMLFDHFYRNNGSYNQYINCVLASANINTSYFFFGNYSVKEEVDNASLYKEAAINTAKKLVEIL